MLFLQTNNDIRKLPFKLIAFRYCKNAQLKNNIKKFTKIKTL
jgi:hypothetical protein